MKKTFIMLFQLVKRGLAKFGEGLSSAWETEHMMKLTAGISVPVSFLDQMREKGWQIRENSWPLTQTRTGAYDYTLSYTAIKDGHVKGSMQWYRDMCDTLGYQRNSIPSSAARSPQTMLQFD